MPSLPFTDRQLAAIRTTDRSVIVSAAAGSGKTAVLAERCAHLVCDLLPDARCDADKLLVLTFTEAAAAEMRSRIMEAIRERAVTDPLSGRLRDQVTLAGAAHISTIHAFCLWMIRRWFSHLGLDPGATLLDENETRLLKREVLAEMFSELYRRTNDPEKPLGSVDAGGTDSAAASPGETTAQAPGQTTTPRSARTAARTAAQRAGGARAGSNKTDAAVEFARLVDDYGLGDDGPIARFVERLYDFTTSLPDAEGWLQDAQDALAYHHDAIIAERAAELGIELQRQIEHCEQVAATLEAADPAGHFHAEQIRAYVGELKEWYAELADPQSVAAPPGTRTEGGRKATLPHPRGDARSDEPRAAGDRDGSEEQTHSILVRFERVRRRVAEFAFSRARAPRMPEDAGPKETADRDAAVAALKQVKHTLFDDRLLKRFGLFTVDECRDGLRKTVPYVRTIVALVRGFRDAYAAKKRELGVLDFSDLEQFAYRLLRGDDDPTRPSDVARALHDRFAHVLVDEFQDINPIQEAILRLVSRESDPDRPGNLFVVGDVKQSIYRFRLAESTIFSKRLRDFRSADTSGAAVFLQTNFRSRGEILDAVNLVFDRLMQGGDEEIVYDDEAQLRPGRALDAVRPRQPVEVHVLEKRWGGVQGDDEPAEPGAAAPDDPVRWTPIEREAYLIGQRIRQMTTSNESSRTDPPLRFRDIAVLLRAKKINAEHVAGQLVSMGIPAYADVAGSLVDTREVRDVLAALEILDNLQQDIPLAAVLRSGILGERLTPDEFVEVRCLDRDIAFHEAVRRYAGSGPVGALRDRIATFLNRVRRFRREVRRRPLADVLWRLYEQWGYLAYAGGLPGGAQRRANLLKLHELTRRFGSFRRQGLHRFLRFMQSMDEGAEAVSAAPAVGEAEDVVRIMSIHQSKGLEFPVVFVAGLGTKLNLGDRNGRMIFEPGAGIGLRVVDETSMIEYPTVAHRRVAERIERTTRAEELRVLYVAMTRARDKLILVGSANNVAHLGTERAHPAPSRLLVATAQTPLDWLMPVLAGAPPGTMSGLSGASPRDPLFQVHVHDVDEMLNWRVSDSGDDDQRALRRAVAYGEALPPSEPMALDDAEVERVMSRIHYVYPWLGTTSVPAAVAASEFKGTGGFARGSWPETSETAAADLTDVMREKAKPSGRSPEGRGDRAAGGGSEEAIRKGVVTHRVLEHLDFSATLDAAGVALELQRMVRDGVIDEEECGLVDAGSIAWFVSTPVAEAIRRAGETYEREFRFVATEPLGLFDPSAGGDDDDHVLVRGIVDGVLPIADGIEIIDFKTDAIPSEAVLDRAECYRSQMDLYARAISRLWRRPVRACRLVFLTARRHVCWDGGGGSQVLPSSSR